MTVQGWIKVTNLLHLSCLSILFLCFITFSISLFLKSRKSLPSISLLAESPHCGLWEERDLFHMWCPGWQCRTVLDWAQDQPPAADIHTLTKRSLSFPMFSSLAMQSKTDVNKITTWTTDYMKSVCSIRNSLHKIKMVIIY